MYTELIYIPLRDNAMIANKLFEPMTVPDSVEFVCEKLRG